jgi:hypothetical protein
MRFRLAVFAVMVLTALGGSTVADASSGVGAGPTTAAANTSRYTSTITYSMTGPLVVGNDVYAGAFSLSESYGPSLPTEAAIQGSAGAHSLSGPCSTSTEVPVFGSGTFICAVDLDGNQASVSLSFTAVQTSETQIDQSDWKWTFAGTYSAS